MDFQPANLARTSGRRAVTATAAIGNIPGGEGEQMRIYNGGSNPCAVVCYSTADAAPSVAVFPTDAQAANGLGTVIAPGAIELFTVGNNDRYSCICDTALTTTIYTTRHKGQ